MSIPSALPAKSTGVPRNHDFTGYLRRDHTGRYSDDRKSGKHYHTGHQFPGNRDRRNIAKTDRRERNDRPIDRLRNVGKPLVESAFDDIHDRSLDAYDCDHANQEDHDLVTTGAQGT